MSCCLATCFLYCSLRLLVPFISLFTTCYTITFFFHSAITFVSSTSAPTLPLLPGSLFALGCYLIFSSILISTIPLVYFSTFTFFLLFLRASSFPLFGSLTSLFSSLLSRFYVPLVSFLFSQFYYSLLVLPCVPSSSFFHIPSTASTGYAFSLTPFPPSL